MHRFRLFSFTLLSLILCQTHSLQGQNTSPEILEFGKVDVDLLLDDLFESYKDEDAIIINDLGRVSLLMISNTPSVQYTYLRRIKILNKEGMKYAKVSIEIDESKGEGLTELKARTHKLNGSGEPVSFPINKKKIKLEREKGVKRVYSFEFPFVEEGAILEYTYQIKAKEIDKLKTWKFHTEIPVVRSELQTFIPRSFEYEPVISGNPQQIQIISDSYRARNAQELIDRERFRRNSNLVSNNSLYGPTSLFGNFKAYIMYAVPSLEKEAFSLDREARGNEISLQLRKESFRGKSNAVVFEDWDELNKHLTKSFKPNKVRVRKKRVHEKSTQIRRKAKGQLLIMENCLAATQRQVKWNKKYGLQSINVERAINKRVGNGAEINLYLYHLLKESGLEAYPVTISTRDHGRVNSRYASLAQFNHVIVLVVIDGEEILLDGSSKLERLGMLPQNDLNQFGYVVNQEGGRWITLKSRNKVNRVTYSRFSLNEAGQLNGQISVENREYSVVLEQKKLEEYEGKNDEYLLEEILIGLKDPKIFDRKLAVPENEKDPLVVSCELRTGDYVEVASEGEIIIIKPMMIKAVLQNPFEKAFRNTPVDFPYPLTDSHMIGIRLPEGYEVAQAPSPIRVLLPNDGGSFTYNVLEMGNIIHFTSAIHINQTTYAPEEYSGIRDFFEYVVSKHQEDIVIRKIQ